MGELATQIVGDLRRLVALACQPAQRIALAEGLHFALLQRHGKDVAGEYLPLDLLVGIDAGLMQHDREEVAIGRGEIGDADRLALQIGNLGDAAGGRCEQNAAQPP